MHAIAAWMQGCFALRKSLHRWNIFGRRDALDRLMRHANGNGPARAGPVTDESQTPLQCLIVTLYALDLVAVAAILASPRGAGNNRNPERIWSRQMVFTS